MTEENRTYEVVGVRVLVRSGSCAADILISIVLTIRR